MPSNIITICQTQFELFFQKCRARPPPPHITPSPKNQLTRAAFCIRIAELRRCKRQLLSFWTSQVFGSLGRCGFFCLRRVGVVSIENCGQMGGKDLSTWIFLMICFWCVCVCVCFFFFVVWGEDLWLWSKERLQIEMYDIYYICIYNYII